MSKCCRRATQLPGGPLGCRRTASASTALAAHRSECGRPSARPGRSRRCRRNLTVPAAVGRPPLEPGGRASAKAELVGPAEAPAKAEQ
eukprot:10143530-Alexandrium_andersonii.AAC.1